MRVMLFLRLYVIVILVMTCHVKHLWTDILKIWSHLRLVFKCYQFAQLEF